MKPVRNMLAALLVLPAWTAAAEEPSNYTIENLLSPCVVADNDAREGAPAETECEQYMVGFTDALAITGQLGKEQGICLPAQNRADELRWAFVRWVHQHFSRRGELAAVGLMDTLKDKFPCS